MGRPDAYPFVEPLSSRVVEREVNEAKAHRATQMQNRHGGEQGLDVVQELRAEIERLRAEVKELRQQVDNR